MQRTGRGHIFVTEGGRLIGVLTLKDLLQYLSVQSELGAADRLIGGTLAHKTARDL